MLALLYAYLVRYFAVAWNGIEPGFARITPAMDAAARSLGASAAQTFRRVHAPLLARSVAAAFLLVFVDVMKELPATLVMRPFNFDTLATQTYQFARDERLAEAALPSLAIVRRLRRSCCCRAMRGWRRASRRRHAGDVADARDAAAGCSERAVARTSPPAAPAGQPDDAALARPGATLRYFQPTRSTIFCAAAVCLPSVAIGSASALNVAHRLERGVLRR